MIMNLRIDLKSALCGLVIGILAMLLVAAATPSSGVGRFRLDATPSYALLVDTTTGQVWTANFVSSASVRGTDADFYSAKD